MPANINPQNYLCSLHVTGDFYMYFKGRLSVQYVHYLYRNFAPSSIEVHCETYSEKCEGKTHCMSGPYMVVSP
jgi:hypothetical protein